MLVNKSMPRREEVNPGAYYLEFEPECAYMSFEKLVKVQILRWG